MNNFEPNRLTNYSDEAIIAEIKRVVSTYFMNKAPKTGDFNRYSRVHTSTIIKRFGSWPEAMKKGGFPYERGPINSIDLTKDLNKIKDLNQGKYFTQTFYVKNGGKYSVETLKKRLGHNSWQNLLENVLSLKKQPKIIKIIKPKPRGFTEEELFLEMSRVWGKFGRRPSYDEFRDNSNISMRVYERKFGTWKKSVEVFCLKFGYDIKGLVGQATPELLLSQLKTIAEKNKLKVLKFSAYKKYGGKYSIGTFQNHFGSWENAVKKIGMKDGHVKYSREELFSELQRIWEKLGRQPTWREMNQYSQISRSVFAKKFGSWTKAIYSFVDDRKGDYEEHTENKEFKTNIEEDKQEVTPLITQKGTTEAKKTGETQIIEMKTPRIPSPRLRFRVLQRDKFMCVICGRKPPEIELQIDHKIPYSNGGETTFDNLQTLCKECNLGKLDTIY